MMFGLEFGCGDTPRKKNFAGVDVRSGPSVQYLCNAWEIINHVKPNTVDVIFSRHFFEHLTFEQGRRTLDAWYSILKPGGEMEMILPDMDHHIRQWLDPNRNTTVVTRKSGGNSTNEQEAIKGFWGGQRGDLLDTWDVHKSGYDFKLLKDTLEQHGFKNVQRVKSAPKNLHIKCKKDA